MNNETSEGRVVIVPTGQAGTIVNCGPSDIWVLLLNGDIWVGNAKLAYEPQSSEELALAPLNVDRFEFRDKAPVIKRMRND